MQILRCWCHLLNHNMSNQDTSTKIMFRHGFQPSSIPPQYTIKIANPARITCFVQFHIGIFRRIVILTLSYSSVCLRRFRRNHLPFCASKVLYLQRVTSTDESCHQLLIWLASSSVVGSVTFCFTFSAFIIHRVMKSKRGKGKCRLRCFSLFIDYSV